MCLTQIPTAIGRVRWEARRAIDLRRILTINGDLMAPNSSRDNVERIRSQYDLCPYLYLTLGNMKKKHQPSMMCVAHGSNAFVCWYSRNTQENPERNQLWTGRFIELFSFERRHSFSERILNSPARPFLLLLSKPLFLVFRHLDGRRSVLVETNPR